MLSKDLKVPVPIYVKKYLESEFGLDEQGRVFANQASILGRILNTVVVDCPYPVVYDNVQGSLVTIRFMYRSKSACVPKRKVEELSNLLRGLFDVALISEARAVHGIVGRYDKAVFGFLTRYGIEIDVDIQEDTARSIYRNYLERIEKKRQKGGNFENIYAQ